MYDTEQSQVKYLSSLSYWVAEVWFVHRRCYTGVYVMTHLTSLFLENIKGTLIKKRHNVDLSKRGKGSVQKSQGIFGRWIIKTET